MPPNSLRSTCLETACWIWLAASLAAPAAADGKGFSRAVSVVDTPDQRVLIWFRDGRQRLVVETTLAGDGDLAWVVPCPAPPQVSPVSRGAFRTLEAQLKPDVRADGGEGLPILLYLLAMLGLVSFLATRRRARLFWLAVPLFLGALLLLPLPTASLGMAPSVTVHGRAQVGAYDVATLSATRPDDLLAWLRGNGYRVAPEAERVIADYVADGWSFAAAKLAPGAEARRPHPLAFDFATKRAVYPMRLTGAGNGPCAIDLYVLGEGRARVAGLDVVACDRLAEADGESWRPFFDGEIALGHPDLRDLRADVVTRLRGTLGPGDMSADLDVVWEPFRFERQVVYTRGASLRNAAETAAATALLAYLALAFLRAILGHVKDGRRARRPWKEILAERVRLENRAIGRIWIVALAGGLATGGVLWATHTRVDAVVVSGGPRIPVAGHEAVAAEVRVLTDLAAARARAKALWAGRVNAYTGGPVREDDSPGNYTLALRDGAVVYTGWDAHGSPIAFPRTP